MDAQKILKVIGMYRSYFTKKGIEAVDFPHNDKPDSSRDILSHCCRMLDRMEKFISESRMDKVFRWLGFIQGCLWSTRRFSLEDLKNHSLPDPKEIEERARRN